MKKSFRILLVVLTVLLSIGMFVSAASATDKPLKDQAAPAKVKLDTKKDAIVGMSDKMEYAIMPTRGAKEPTATSEVTISAGTKLLEMSKIDTMHPEYDAEDPTKHLTNVGFTIFVRMKAVAGSANASPWARIDVPARAKKPVIIGYNAAAKLKAGEIMIDWDNEVFRGVTDAYEYEVSTKAGKWAKTKGSKTDAANFDLSKLGTKGAKFRVRLSSTGEGIPAGIASDWVTILPRPGKLAKTVPVVDTIKEQLTMNVAGASEESEGAEWQYTLETKTNITWVDMIGNGKFTSGDVTEPDEGGIIDLNAAFANNTEKNKTSGGKTVSVIDGGYKSIGVRIKWVRSLTEDGDIDQLQGKFSSPMLQVKIPKVAKPVTSIKYNYIDEKIIAKKDTEYLQGIATAVINKQKDLDPVLADFKSDLRFYEYAPEVDEEDNPIALSQYLEENYGYGKITGKESPKPVRPSDDPKAKVRKILVRTAAVQGKSFASAWTAVELPSREAAPAVAIDYAAEQITGVTKNMQYAIEMMPAADAEEEEETPLSWKAFTVDSAFGISGTVDEVAVKGGTGEDKDEPLPETPVTIYVRTAPTKNAVASLVTVLDLTPRQEPIANDTITATAIDYEKETLTGLPAAANVNDLWEYSITDGSSWVAIKGLTDTEGKAVLPIGTLISEEDAVNLQFRVKAVKGTKTVPGKFASRMSGVTANGDDNADGIISIPARPTLTVEVEDGEYGEWSILTYDPSDTTKIEYKNTAVTPEAWKKVTGNTTDTDDLGAYLISLLSGASPKTTASLQFRIPAVASTSFASKVTKAISVKQATNEKITATAEVVKTGTGVGSLTVTLDSVPAALDAIFVGKAAFTNATDTAASGYTDVTDNLEGSVITIAGTNAATYAPGSTLYFGIYNASKVLIANGSVKIPTVKADKPSDPTHFEYDGSGDGVVKAITTEADNYEVCLTSTGTYAATATVSKIAEKDANKTVNFYARTKGTGYLANSDGQLFKVTLKYPEGGSLTGEITK